MPDLSWLTLRNEMCVAFHFSLAKCFLVFVFSNKPILSLDSISTHWASSQQACRYFPLELEPADLLSRPPTILLL